MTIIFDGNNIFNIAHSRAKGLKIKEMKDELKKHDEDSKSYEITKNKYEEEISKYLTSFSVQIFLNMLHKYLKENKKAQFYFVWDARNGSAWRKGIVPAYKGTRKDKKDDPYFKHFVEAIESEQELLKHYPIYQLLIDGAEADDIIYTLCNMIDDDIKIISSDGDMIQLAQQNNKIEIYNPITKKNPEIPDYDIVLYKAICGDTSDNIQGLFKFGPKKTLKTIEENLENLTDEQKDIVNKFIDIIDLSKNPNNENNHKQVTDLLQNYKINVDAQQIQKMFFSLKLRSFLAKWDNIKSLLLDLEKNYERKEKS